MVSIAAMIAACRSRVLAARGIADRCRQDEETHRLAMSAVFVLEDTLFTLESIAAVGADARAGAALGAPADAARERD